MRKLLYPLLLLAVLLGGCAAPPPAAPPVVKKPKTEVTPRPLQVSRIGGTGTEQQLALALLSHYLGAPLYRMSNPLPMSRNYQISEAMRSPDGQQLVVTMRSRDTGERWAFVTASVAPGAVMNAFNVVRDGEPGYALVLKRVRFCLVEGADQPPVWGGHGWAFSHTRPGRFECSGQTRGSLYQAYSGMPGLLGDYFQSGDTVLYDRHWGILLQIASNLAALFPNLQVPQIR